MSWDISVRRIVGVCFEQFWWSIFHGKMSRENALSGTFRRNGQGVVWEKNFEGVIFHERSVWRECPWVGFVLDGCPAPMRDEKSLCAAVTNL